MKTVSLILAVTLAVSGCAAEKPLLVGAEAEKALTDCVLADLITTRDMGEYQASGVRPEGMRERMLEAADLCEITGQIDVGDLPLKSQWCIAVFPARAAVYRGTVEVLLTEGATVREGDALSKDIDTMNRLMRLCAEPPADSQMI